MPPAKKKVESPVEPGYTWEELLPLVRITLEAGISVLLRGHPGVGKSTLAAELAKAMDLPLVDIRLAQRDPSEIGGITFPDRERQVLALYAPEWVKAACERPTFVFLDEVNAAVTKLHQAAAYQIVLEHRVGPFVFHPGTVVMAAGNLEEDNAIVSSLSSALTNRFAHYELRVHAPSWLRWGAAAGIDETILAYIGRYGEEALYSNDGNHAFPSPRSWEMASRVYGRADEDQRRRVVTACVGIEAGLKLFDFLRIYHRVDAEAIVLRGAAVDFTKGKNADPSFVYAAVFSVAAWIAYGAQIPGACLPHVVRFLRSPGLDPEYALLFLRQLNAKGALMIERLRAVPEFRKLAGDLVSLQVAMRP